jgi:P-type Cu+ transporter
LSLPLKSLETLPVDRPEAPRQICPVCGSQVDPLRAGEVLLFDDGFRYLCGAQCRQAFLDGTRYRTAWQPNARPAATRERPSSSGYAEGVTHRNFDIDAGDSYGQIRWAGVAAVCAAVLIGFFGNAAPAAIISAIFTGLASVAALWASTPAIAQVGWLAWALGPTGACLAAIGAAQAIIQGNGSWLGLEGAAVAGAAMVARVWLDARASAPVAQAVRSLIRTLPTKTRIVAKDAVGPTAPIDESPVDAVRIGDEICAQQGDIVAIDGIIQSGQATALIYPASRVAVPRTSGDTLFAGSKIVSGAVRIVASRIGEQRALARPESFGKSGGSASLMSRIAMLVARWGGLATLLLAITVIAMTDSGGIAAELSAAGAVLLAAPLLAIRRAAESPLVAASAAAVARGIVFRDANALDLAGKTAVMALSPEGTLTEGRPHVVEVHSLEKNMTETLVSLAAGAEDVAVTDPVASAIQLHAKSRSIAPVPARRAIHLPGRGILATAASGEPLLVGNRKLLLDQSVSVAAADALATAAEDRGQSAIFIALGNRVRGVFVLQDSLRPGARAAVQSLLDQGVEIALLTGEQRVSVEKLAADLDIAHIKAGLLPEERAKEVKLLRDAGGKVAAVGHPQTDAAVLNAADVGIAQNAAGGIAGEYAIMLGSNDIRDAASAIWIARAAREGALRATSIAAIAFSLIVAAAATGLIIPAIAAFLAVAVDAYGVGVGARLLRRINLRVPEAS